MLNHERRRQEPDEDRAELPDLCGEENMSDLLKSVREVRGCGAIVMVPFSGYGPERHDVALVNTQCDSCLRLVLAHCGKKAAEITGLSVNHGEGEDTVSDCCDGDHIERAQNAIRREFGVTS